jgi:hypothetical protein
MSTCASDATLGAPIALSTNYSESFGGYGVAA